MSFSYLPTLARGMCFICLSSSALAQNSTQDDKKHTHLEHVFVTLPGYTSAEDSGLATTVINGDTLKNNAASSLGETIQSLPGLHINSFGPSVGQPVIRGQNGARILVLQNGTQNADASSVSVDHAITVEPLLAESIEILHGPSTLLYGGGAIGGVVNIIDSRIPNTIPDETSFKAELRHGSVNDENTGVVALTTGFENTALHFNAIKRDTNDTNVPQFSIVDSDERVLENTSVELDAFTLGGSYLFDEGYIGLAYSQRDHRYGIPEGVHGHGHEDEEEEEHEEGEEEHEEEEEAVVIDMHSKRFDLRGDFHHINKTIDTFRWSITHTQYEHDELEGDEIGTSWERDSSEYRAEILLTPRGQWQSILGVQATQSDLVAVGEESYLPPSDTNNLGVFFIQQRKANNWNFEAGLRFEQSEVSAQGAQKKSYDSLSFSTSALIDLTSSFQLGLAASHSERAPVTEELFSNNANAFGNYVEHVATGIIEVGSTELSSEKSNNLDITLSYTNEKVDSFVTIFYNKFSDYIYLKDTQTEQDEVEVFAYTQDDADFSGIEFEVTRSYELNNNMTFKAGILGDSVRGRLDDNSSLPRLPEDNLGLKFSLDTQNTTTELSWQHGFETDAQPENDATASPSFDRVNLLFNFDTEYGETQTTYFVKAKNLLNDTIRNPVSFIKDVAPESGRSIELGIRLEL